MKFIDEIEIRVASGHGGPGSISFRRESMTPRGGPDGGDGGKGGDLIFRAHSNLNSLVDFRNRKRYAAADGGAGESKMCSGANAEDLVLMVPPGTVIRGEDGVILADLTDVNEVVLLKGGRGGKGNTFFKTSVNQAPEKAQPGEEGQALTVRLELKLIADVGIIGLPNAGKSTLISRISSARPKIADYPFTTLTPNLGVVSMGEFESFVVADIPGLIRGAHKGVGLGIQFLKHIERTRVFVHMVDVSTGNVDEARAAYSDIQEELRRYDEMNHDRDGFFPLTTRPQLLVFNKADAQLPEIVEDCVRTFKKEFNVAPLVISAVAGKGVDTLLFRLKEFVLAGKENPDENL